MFKCVINDVKQFTSTITVTEKIVEEIRFTADSEGLRYNQLDRSHVSFINMEADTDYFLDYEIDEPETFVVDAQEMVKILKREKKDTIT